jgi:hypothetical protein
MTAAIRQATLTPAQVETLRQLPHGPWNEVDDGHHTARLLVDADSLPARRALTVIRPLFDMTGVDYTWVELSALKRQRNGGRCAPHTDTESPFCRGRVLSLSVGLTPADAYEGGLLVVDGRQIRLSEGDAVVFPSALRHRVSAVSAGTRYSLVARALGPDGHATGTWLFGPDRRARRCPQATETEIAGYYRQNNQPRSGRT